MAESDGFLIQAHLDAMAYWQQEAGAGRVSLDTSVRRALYHLRQVIELESRPAIDAGYAEHFEREAMKAAEDLRRAGWDEHWSDVLVALKPQEVAAVFDIEAIKAAMPPELAEVDPPWMEYEPPDGLYDDDRPSWRNRILCALLITLALGAVMAAIQLATGWSAADQVCETMEMMR